MAKIAGISASLSLESAAFIRDMAKSQRAVKTNTDKMQRHMRDLQKSAQRVQG